MMTRSISSIKTLSYSTKFRACSFVNTPAKRPLLEQLNNTASASMYCTSFNTQPALNSKSSESFLTSQCINTSSCFVPVRFNACASTRAPRTKPGPEPHNAAAYAYLGDLEAEIASDMPEDQFQDGRGPNKDRSSGRRQHGHQVCQSILESLLYTGVHSVCSMWDKGVEIRMAFQLPRCLDSSSFSFFTSASLSLSFACKARIHKCKT